MIDLDLFYIAAGLITPNEWEVQRLAHFRHQVFLKIPDFLSNKTFEVPNINRRSGKTTKAVIECLHAEWHGYDTAIVCPSVVEQYFVKSTYNNLKRLILAKFGPPLEAGKSSIITASSKNYYSGFKLILDL
jgi:hypothetical protein